MAAGGAQAGAGRLDGTTPHVTWPQCVAGRTPHTSGGMVVARGAPQAGTFPAAGTPPAAREQWKMVEVWLCRALLGQTTRWPLQDAVPGLIMPPCWAGMCKEPRCSHQSHPHLSSPWKHPNCPCLQLIGSELKLHPQSCLHWTHLPAIAARGCAPKIRHYRGLGVAPTSHPEIHPNQETPVQ